MTNGPNKRTLPLSTALYPIPAVLVTCGDAEIVRNAITLAWVGTASSDPPTIAIGVRPVRYSFGLIQRYSDFVVNLPKASQADILAYCGSVSGRNEDKFQVAGLTPIKADIVRAPLVAEFPVNIECKVKTRLSLGSHDLFVGEVVSVHADHDVLADGEVDPDKADPVAYFQGVYHRLGKAIPVRR